MLSLNFFFDIIAAVRVQTESVSVVTRARIGLSVSHRTPNTDIRHIPIFRR
jgi:hypothetical protein